MIAPVIQEAVKLNTVLNVLPHLLTNETDWMDDSISPLTGFTANSSVLLLKTATNGEQLTCCWNVIKVVKRFCKPWSKRYFGTKANYVSNVWNLNTGIYANRMIRRKRDDSRCLKCINLSQSRTFSKKHNTVICKTSINSFIEYSQSQFLELINHQ